MTSLVVNPWATGARSWMPLLNQKDVTTPVWHPWRMAALCTQIPRPRQIIWTGSLRLFFRKTMVLLFPTLVMPAFLLWTALKWAWMCHQTAQESEASHHIRSRRYSIHAFKRNGWGDCSDSNPVISGLHLTGKSPILLDKSSCSTSFQEGKSSGSSELQTNLANLHIMQVVWAYYPLRHYSPLWWEQCAVGCLTWFSAKAFLWDSAPNHHRWPCKGPQRQVPGWCCTPRLREGLR